MTNKVKKVSTPLNVENYENDIEQYESMGAKYIGADYFSWDDLEVSDRLYQTRASDADLGHIAALAEDINNMGLRTLPIIEFDPMTMKYNVLSGFHRLLAMHKNNDSPEVTKNKYPAVVLEFTDNNDRQMFLQNENNHRPAKPHGKLDAVHFIKTMKKQGYFDKYGKDSNAIQKEVYSLLGKYYPRIKTTTKAGVYEEALTTKIQKFRTWTAAEAADESERRYGKKLKSGKVEGDVCYITSDFNVARKTIYIATADRAAQIYDKKASNRLSIKLVTWSPKNFHNVGHDIDAFRKNALKHFTVMNNDIWLKSNVSYVSEVTFLHQALAPVKEKFPILYRWSMKNNCFELVSRKNQIKEELEDLEKLAAFEAAV